MRLDLGIRGGTVIAASEEFSVGDDATTIMPFANQFTGLEKRWLRGWASRAAERDDHIGKRSLP